MIRVAFAAAGLLALTGCAATGRIDSGYPFPTEAAAAASKVGGLPLRQMQLDVGRLLEERVRPIDRQAAAVEAPGVNILGKRPGTDPRLDILIASVRYSPDPEALRNDVVVAWMAASTANCSVYVQALRSGQVSSRLLSDFLAGGFATASTLTTPIRNAKILAGLSAFSTAEGSSVDRNIFAQQGAELIADAILQIRAEDRARLEGKLRRSYDDWPMALAITDLFEFHSDCSMLRGFSRMREALLTREQTVQAIREATSNVARAGGSPDQMMAVLAALQSGKGPPPAVAETKPAWDKDLTKLKTAAEQCLQQAMAELTRADLTKPAEVTKALDTQFAAGKACPADATWPNAFNTLAQTAANEGVADLAKAIADGDAAIAEAKTEEASVDPKDTAAVKAAAEKTSKAGVDKNTNVAAAVAAATRAYRSSADLDRRLKANVREIVFAQLAEFRDGSATQVANVLKNARSGASADDPALEAAAVDVADVASKNNDGALAARRAVAAGKAVIDT